MKRYCIFKSKCEQLNNLVKSYLTIAILSLSRSQMDIRVKTSNQLNLERQHQIIIEKDISKKFPKTSNISGCILPLAGSHRIQVRFEET